MAYINLQKAPDKFMAAGNPILVVFRSTNSGVAKVRLKLFDLRPALSTLLAEWTQGADISTTDTFTFQLDELLEDALGYGLAEPGVAGEGFNVENCMDYSFIAQPLDVAGNIFSGAFISTTYFALNAIIPDNIQPNLLPYLAENRDKIFLTDAPAEKYIRFGESEYLSMISAETGPYEIYVDRFQRDGSIGTLSIPMLLLGAKPSGRMGIGPANLEALGPNFLDANTTHYKVSLSGPFGQNLFTDGDQGAFEQNMTGIQPVNGFAVDRSTFASHQGNYSLRTLMQNTNSVWTDMWRGTATIAFKPNTTYLFKTWVYYDKWKTTSGIGAVRLYPVGLTDATVQATYMLVDFNQAPGEFLELSTQLTTGTDVNGQLAMQQLGPLDGFYLFADRVSVREVGTAPGTRTYILDRDCTTDSTRLHFLNRLGGSDSFTFTGTEKRRLTVASETFTRNRSAYWSHRQRGKQVIKKEAVEKLICTSGPLTPETMRWLEQLLTSPSVYIEKGGKNYPVVVRDGDFELVDRVQNIHKLRIELEYANTARSQRN